MKRILKKALARKVFELILKNITEDALHEALNRKVSWKEMIEYVDQRVKK